MLIAMQSSSRSAVPHIATKYVSLDYTQASRVQSHLSFIRVTIRNTLKMKRSFDQFRGSAVTPRPSARVLHYELKRTALDNFFARVAVWMGLLLIALITCAKEAHATDGLEISLVAEVRQEVEVSPGRRVSRLVPAQVLRQGQEIFYTVRIRNAAATPAQNVEVVQRIPQNTRYVPKSAAGPGARVSVSADGGVTFGDEGQMIVTDQSAVALMHAPADKSALTRPASASDYTHLRWRLRNPLAPGAVALARFRAVFL
jgi:uncharacterized repeat protein (TIGR01451 family)